jgi:DnaA-homolog protein
MAIQLPVSFEFRANQTFDDYYPGCNQEIIQHLKATAQGTGEPFIFLWGEQGFGKSHLLQACCQEASRQNTRVFYLDLSNHINGNTQLISDLDNIELACIDNIDFIAGNAEWELACFNLFNRQREQQHRLLMSASCPMHYINLHLADLKTRFNWGLSLKIQPLDDDDKIAALIHKSQRMGIELAPQAARFLLSRFDRSLASLWLMLDKLDWASLAAKRKLTIPFLKQVLDQTD